MNKIIYNHNDIRFGRVAEWERILGRQFDVPNVFMQLLYDFYDKIPNLCSIDTFIETGTHKGDTSELASELFNNVITIEKYPDKDPYNSENLREYHKKIYETHANISFMYGDSHYLLKDIIKNLNNRSVILLDAHSSSSCNLINELSCINESEINDHVIILDDFNDVGSGGWPSFEEIRISLLQINYNYTIIRTEHGRGTHLIY